MLEFATTFPNGIICRCGGSPRTVISPIAMSQVAPPMLAEFVRQRRKANGMTQRELADLAGVGLRFISELERAKPTLRLSTVNSVLAVFGKQLGIVDAIRVKETDE